MTNILIVLGCIGAGCIGGHLLLLYLGIPQLVRSRQVTCDLWAYHTKELRAYLAEHGGKTFNCLTYEDFYNRINDHLANVAEHHPEEVKLFCVESRLMWDRAIKAVLAGEDKK